MLRRIKMAEAIKGGGGESACSKKSHIEVADIIREHIGDYQNKYTLTFGQYKVVYDLLNCRTEYLGGHIERCDHCGAERIAYNSCRNRHCPKCQNIPREKWIEARKSELLPVIYFHNIFTLPHDLNSLILSNKKVMLNILFKSVSETLLTFGNNPNKGLGGKLGFITILHTWDQLLNAHFHLHCVIPGGAISNDWMCWNPSKDDYLFNVEALSLVFRGKFIDYMTKAYHKGTLSFSGISASFGSPEGFQKLKDRLYSHNWVVYSKEPLTCPDNVLEYLGRYTHRVAISNSRIISLEDGKVTFKYKNRKTNQMDETTLDAVEFIRRFLLHTLPKGFVRIRHFGFLANRNKRANLKKIRQVLGVSLGSDQYIEKSLEEIMLQLTGIDITMCPICKRGKMHVVEEIPEGTGLSAAHIIKPSIKNSLPLADFTHANRHTYD